MIPTGWMYPIGIQVEYSNYCLTKLKETSTYGMVRRGKCCHFMPVSCVFEEEKLHFIRNLGKEPDDRYQSGLGHECFFVSVTGEIEVEHLTCSGESLEPHS